MTEFQDLSNLIFLRHPHPMCLYDPASLRFLAVNDALTSCYGYTPEEMLAMRVSDVFLPEDRERLQTTVASLVDQRKHLGLWRQQTKSGGVLWMEMASQSMTYGDKPARLVVATNVSERRETEAALQEAERNYRSIFENAVEGIFQTSPEGRSLRANPALARIYGYESPGDLMTHLTDISHQLYVSPADRARFAELMQQSDAVTGFEAEIYCKDGSRIWISEHARAVRDEHGGLRYYEGMVEDITARKHLEAERERLLQEAIEQADRDPLTGLWNHRAFHKRLQDEADRAIREGSPLAIAVVDLDNFKFFNDAYGHAVGDEVLRLVAENLRECCRASDVIARFGGDEFAILLPGSSQEKAGRLAERLQAHLASQGYRPEAGIITLHLSLTNGVAILPDDGLDRLAVLENTDARLLRTKSGGGEDGSLERLRATLTTRVEGFSMLDALVTAVDNKDRYTRRHSEDVLTYSLQIAEELGLDGPVRQTLATAALLHDVGKIGVPDKILRKPGRLTDEEFEAIRQHPVMGATLVGTVSGLADTLDAIRHHHERWDGGGYPGGLTAKQTPRLARIMAVADAYSAMTMDRPYRMGIRPGEALHILEQGAGTQWDPVCVQAFRRACRTRADKALHRDSLHPAEPLSEALIH